MKAEKMPPVFHCRGHFESVIVLAGSEAAATASSGTEGLERYTLS